MHDPLRDWEPPLEPAYPFNAAGEDIVLYSGPLAEYSVGEVSGAVLLRCSPKIDVAWHIDQEQVPPFELFNPGRNVTELRVRRGGNEYVLAGNNRGSGEGWIGSATIGSETVPLRQVLAHWLNLPPINGNIQLRVGTDTAWQSWTGRWRATIDDWALTLDCRRDHTAVWDAIREQDVIAVTHVMEIQRSDGRAFTVRDVQPLLKSLHAALSFALGRWVAPALPVGIDETGERVWEEWSPVLCESGRGGGLAWWYFLFTNDLENLLQRTIPRFTSTDWEFITWILLSTAVQVNRAGFVEQRIMTAFSGIELVAWTTLVLGGQMSRSEYERLNTAARLRRALAAAQVPAAIDAVKQPALAQFAASQGNNQPLDGPAAISQVRNRIVHPKSPQDEVYHIKGLITDTWLLARHYLNLLILHWLGYDGRYQAVLGPGGWAGSGKPVPWSA